MKAQRLTVLSILAAGAVTLAGASALAQDTAQSPDQTAVQQTAPAPATTKPGKPRKPGKPLIQEMAAGLKEFLGKPVCIKWPKRFRIELARARAGVTKVKGLIQSMNLPHKIKAELILVINAQIKLPKEPAHVLQGTLSSCSRHIGDE